MTEITYREALSQALIEEMEEDERVFIMGEEVGVFQGAYRVTQGLLERFGEMRVRDTPIAEEAFIGAAIGAAQAGLRPIVEVMTFNFSLVAMDQIVNNAAKLRYMSGGQFTIPLVIRGPGGPAHQLAAQHSQNLEAWYAQVPGLKVVMPSTPSDAKGLLKSSIRDDNPVIFIENELLYGVRGEVPEDGDHTVPLGVGEVKREGSDVTVVAHSKMTHLALEAAAKLEKEGISIEVIDPRTIKPLDEQILIKSVEKTNRCVIVEEGCRFAGIGAEFADCIYQECFDLLDAPIQRVAGLDIPIPYSKTLEKMSVPTLKDVVVAVKKVLYL